MATRRHPELNPVPKIPPLQAKDDPNSTEGITRRFLGDLASVVEGLVAAVRSNYGSTTLAAPHGSSHSADGSDPLVVPGTPTTIEAGDAAVVGVGPGNAYEDHQHAVSTAAPSHPTGTAAAQGSGTALMRADATIEQGIVTTKGDLLGYGSTPDRLPVGADYTLLEADSGQALGVGYSSASTVLGRVLTGQNELISHDGAAVAVVAGGTYPQRLIASASGQAYYEFAWNPYITETAFTSGAAKSVLSVDLTDDLTYCSGEYHYSFKVDNGTDIQVKSGVAYWQAVRKGATVTAIATVDETKQAQDTSAGAGITVAFTEVVVGTLFTLKVTLTTALVGSPTWLASGYFQVTSGYYQLTPLFFLE